MICGYANQFHWIFMKKIGWKWKELFIITRCFCHLLPDFLYLIWSFFVFLINYMDWQTQWWKRYQCKFSDNQVCDTLNLGIFHFAPISIIQILSCFCMCHLRSHLNPTFLATHRNCLNLRGCFLKWDIFVYWITMFMISCCRLSIQYDSDDKLFRNW